MEISKCDSTIDTMMIRDGGMRWDDDTGCWYDMRWWYGMIIRDGDTDGEEWVKWFGCIHSIRVFITSLLLGRMQVWPASPVHSIPIPIHYPACPESRPLHYHPYPASPHTDHWIRPPRIIVNRFRIITCDWYEVWYMMIRGMGYDDTRYGIWWCGVWDMRVWEWFELGFDSKLNTYQIIACCCVFCSNRGSRKYSIWRQERSALHPAGCNRWW